jgi:hypothetical protein
MKRLLILAIVASILAFAPAPAKAVTQESIASWTNFPHGEFVNGGDLLTRLFQMVMKKEQAVLSYPYEVAASNTLSIDGKYSFVFLSKTTGNTTNKATIGTTTAALGQLLYVFNDSATAASILSASTGSVATCSASGGVAHLFFASGTWRLLEDQ